MQLGEYNHILASYTEAKNIFLREWYVFPMIKPKIYPYLKDSVAIK